MPANYKVLDNCLCCDSRFLYPYLNLGTQPPCNAFYKVGDTPPEPFPLELLYCGVCHHSQLSMSVSPRILFSNYPYRTGVSSTLRAHYEELAYSILHHKDQARFSDRLKILDIGCNDGTLLNGFKKLAEGNRYWLETYGVDPCKVEDAVGIDNFLEGCWNESLISHYRINEKTFDIITATNVLAHNDNPRLFLQLAGEVLKDDGIMVVEFPYARDMLLKLEFDTIYHEHVSYFLMGPLIELMADTCLYIADVEIIEIHGGSLRLMLRKCHRGAEGMRTCEKAREIQREENLRYSFTKPVFYEGFQGRVDNLKARLLREIYKYTRHDNYSLVGFGASGKSSVVLNYCDLRPSCVYDETKSKLDRLTPGTDVPIKHPFFSAEREEKLAFLIMSWNCMEESVQKIRRYRGVAPHSRDDVCVTYIPRVESGPLH